ncbi:MAG: hypothetical protein IKE18_05415, partial [Oscillospiraceae bacterium]|nr:hypothetical protein [Oscillospiraceae bacterium]
MKRFSFAYKSGHGPVKRLSASILVIAMLMQLMQAALIPYVYAEEVVSSDSAVAAAEEMPQDMIAETEDKQDPDESSSAEEQVAAADGTVSEDADKVSLPADEEDAQEEKIQDSVSEEQDPKDESSVIQDAAEVVSSQEEEQKDAPEAAAPDEAASEITEPSGSVIAEETETAASGDESEKNTAETAEETIETAVETAEETVETAEGETEPFEKVISEGITASDGKAYLISVTYDETSGIPENGPMLRVSEITESDVLYTDYMDKTAEELGVDETGLSHAVAFDISIVSTDDPAYEYEPECPVKVAIEIPDEDPDIAKNSEVVHFGDEIEKMESRYEDDAIQFETEGFSVYVIVPGTSEEPEHEDDPLGLDGNTYYIGSRVTKNGNVARSVYYMMDTLVTSTNNVRQIRKTAANDISSAVPYHFVSAGENGKYYIYRTESGGVEKYIQEATGGSGKDFNFVNSIDTATAFTVTTRNGAFVIKSGNKSFNVQGEDAGPGFQLYTATNNQEDLMQLIDVTTVSIDSDMLNLDGVNAVIVSKQNASSGRAMMASLTNGTRLKTEDVTLETSSGSTRVRAASDDKEITVWTFESAGGKYYLKADTGEYLVLTSSGLSLASSKDSASVISVVTGTAGTQYEGMYRFAVLEEDKLGATALKLNGNQFVVDSTNGDVRQSSQWLSLALPDSIDITYKYDTLPDGVTAEGLPTNTTETVSWGDGTTVLAESATDEIHASSPKRDVTYEFSGWKINGTEYSAGSSQSLSVISGGKDIVAEAVWEETEVVYKPVTVEYVVEATPIEHTMNFDPLPKTTGEPQEEISSENAGEYVLQDVDNHYYTRVREEGLVKHFPYFTYEFKGWKTESGEIIYPGTEIDLLARDENGGYLFDADEDGRTVLVSAWSYTWSTNVGSYPSACFSFWNKVTSEENGDPDRTDIPERMEGWTPSVSGAIIHGLDKDGNIIYSDEIGYPARGGNSSPNIGTYYEQHPQSNVGGRYMMMSHVDLTIRGADEAIRQLASDGYTTSDSLAGEVKWKLSSMPTDEEVLEGLRRLINNGDAYLLDENDRRIPASELTTQNFKVYWVQVKYQSGARDGWNVNGTIMRRSPYADLTVTKQVTGEAGDTDGTFTFTLAVDDDTTSFTVLRGEETETVANSGTFTLSAGESVTIKDLPRNTDITLSEAVNDYAAAWKLDGENLDSESADGASSVLFSIDEDATITVTNRKEPVTLEGYSGEYDGQSHPAVLTSETTAGATVEYSTDGGTTWSSNIPSITNVGDITVIVRVNDPVRGNGTATATLSITASDDLTITTTDYSGIYDANSHEASVAANVTEGTEIQYSTDNGETWTTEVPSITNVGTVNVLVKATKPNYVTAEGSLTLEVTAKAVTVKANNSTKVYGDEDPEFSAAVTGTLGSDTVEYTISRTGDDEDVGTYEGVIVPAGEEIQSNYKVTYQNGNFEITRSDELAVTTTDYSGTYDANSHEASVAANVTEGTEIQYSTDNGETWTTEVPSITN